MYLTDSLRVLLRRWYVLVAGGIVLLALGMAVIKTVPTSYQASGQLLLLPPSAAVATVPTTTNPYLELEPEFTASLIASTVMTTDISDEMAAAGFSAEYTTAVVPETGPLIAITVKDVDAAKAIATRDELINRMSRQLESVQEREEVPAERYITARSFATPSQAEPLSESKMRALALLFAIGGALILSLAFRLDRAARMRAEARLQRAQRQEPAEPQKAAQSQQAGSNSHVDPAAQLDPAAKQPVNDAYSTLVGAQAASASGPRSDPPSYDRPANNLGSNGGRVRARDK